jgi:membrane-associated progesterone receptor component
VNAWRISFAWRRLSAAVLAFVLVGALSVAIVQVYMSMSGGSTEAMNATSTAMRGSTVPGRAVRASELSVCDGVDGAPLYIGVKDPRSAEVTVFDVASGKDFYGPGGPYHVFVARDATLGLARSSMDPSSLLGSVDDLTASERDTHVQWYDKYASKYPRVGFLVPDGVLDEDAHRADSSGGIAGEKKDS